MSKEVIRYRKVVTYPMPEDLWDDMESWYKDITSKMLNLNPSVDLGGDRNYGDRIVSLTKEVLQSRLDNKNETTGDFGYGKIFKKIIGQYHISIEDEEGLQKKIMVLDSIIEIFNKDEKLIYFDPLASKKKDVKSQYAEINAEQAVEIALLLNAINNPKKLSVGSAMGFINKTFPHLKDQMKDIAPLIGKGVGVMKGRLNKDGVEDLQEDLEVKYPDFAEAGFGKDEGPSKLETPIIYAFDYTEDRPERVLYELNDDLYEIPLADMIKKMKHDKAAYEYLHQHKPGGPMWPDVATGEYTLVISNDPFLNLTKSSGRHWAGSSCEKISNSSFNYSQGGISDIRYGNCIAFAFEGGSVNEGWPEKQPDSKILLGRQNLKWGFKDDKKGDLGIGLDPMFYPRAGGSRWAKLLNKALALIIDSHGYLDFKSLKTPYSYIGHCDVGSGTGILNYRSGTTCYTNVKQDVVNPDLLVAANTLINSHQFERLTRPLASMEVKMLLAQNPNIWALPNREVGIGRLLRLKNLEMIKFLVRHETADPQALLGITELIPEIDPEYDNALVRDNLTFLICNHPNSNAEIHKRLLELVPQMKLDRKKVDSIDVLFGGLGNRGNVEPLLTHPPYVNYGDLSILQETIKRAKRKRKPIDKLSLARSVLFAPLADREVYNEGVRIIRQVCDTLPRDNQTLEGRIRMRCSMEVFLSYFLPLNVKGSWCFNQRPYDLDFDIFGYKTRDYEIDRQSDDVLKEVLFFYKEFKSFYDNATSIMMDNIRDSSVFKSLWRIRRRLQIRSFEFTRYGKSPLDFNKPSSEAFFGSKELIAALDTDDIYELKYDYVDGDERRLRKNIPSKFAQRVIENNSFIEALGWGYVALWLSDPVKHFEYFQERVFDYSFSRLYKGNGEFEEAPENPFELYNLVANINTLQEAAVDSVLNEGGLARNNRLPINMQNSIYNNWNILSQKYGGSYDEYMDNLIMALCENPNTDGRLLYDFAQDDKMKKSIASNSSTPKRLLNRLYSDYPVEVLCNSNLSDASFNKFWKYTMRILRVQVDKDINELYNKFEINSILDRNKGSKYRKSLLAFLGANKYAKYWRAGLVKKGIWNQISGQRVSEEGIADYPIIFNEGKTIVIKFNNEPDKHYFNEVYELDEIKSLKRKASTSKGETLFLRGRVHKWKELKDGGYEKVIENINENVLVNEFFNYIPPENRGDDVTTTDEDGNTVVVNAPRWTVDNIVVINDPTAERKGEKLPSWRFEITQEQVDNLVYCYIKRGQDIQKLLDDLSVSINTPQYVLGAKNVFAQIERANAWDKDLINNNISLLLNNNAEILNTITDLPLTKFILDLSLSQTPEDIKEKYGIPDLSLAMLNPLKSKILSYDYVPIGYIFTLLHQYPPPNIMASAEAQRLKRAKEYNAYYENIMSQM